MTQPDQKTVFRNGLLVTLSTAIFVNQAMSVLVQLAQGAVKSEGTKAVFTVDGKLLDDITALSLAFSRFDQLNPNYKVFLDVAKKMMAAKKEGKSIDPEIDAAIEELTEALKGPFHDYPHTRG